MRRIGKVVTGVLAIAAAIACSGCAGASLVAARAAEDLRCPEKDIKVTSLEMSAYEASGCGKSARYVVRGGEVLTDSGGD
jgi:hypothetical protein